MKDGRSRYRDLRDPYTKRFWPFRTGRDPARTPMRWNGSAQAGFIAWRPCLPVSSNAATCNVERESMNPASLVSLYRRLIHLRKTTPTLMHRSCIPLEVDHPNCLAFLRKDQRMGTSGQEILVAVNFAARRTSCSVSGTVRSRRLLLTTHEPTVDRQIWKPGRLELQPDEAVILA